MVRFGVALALVALGATSARAQESKTFYLHTRSDTLFAERVARAPGRLTGEMTSRVSGQRWNFAAEVTAQELVTRLSNEFRLMADSAGSVPQQSAVLEFRGDSVIAEVRTGGGALTQRLGTKAGAVPYVNPSFALIEQALRRARVLGGDRTEVPLFSVSGGQTLPLSVTRVGTDSVVIVLGGTETRLAVDAQDGIRGGTIPAQRLTLSVSSVPDPAFFRSVKLDYSPPAGAPYTAEEVRVPTPAGHTLAGTLTLPLGARGPVPAMVMITGSGLQDRDEAIPIIRGFRPFREIADALGRRGIAVLRMDDRGVGGSGGNPQTATGADFADDIRAGLAYLRGRAEVDGRRLGLIGHSEGGTLAPLIASTDSLLAGIVLLAGTAWTGRRISEYQNRDLLEHDPKLTPSQRDSIMRNVVPRALDSVAVALPWFKFWAEYDPLVTARKVRTPVLILQGGTDHQVSPEQAGELAAAFRQGGNRDVTVRVFPLTNHLFLADPDGYPAGYSELKTNRLRAEVVDTLVEWLLKRLRP